MSLWLGKCPGSLHSLRNHALPCSSVTRASLPCCAYKKDTVTALAVKAEVRDEDAFVSAALRLQGILENARWDNGAALQAEVASYTVDMRLMLISNLGSMLGCIGITLAWIFGEDPVGGFRFSGPSYEHLLQGVGFGAPLVLCSLLGRTQAVHSAFPILADLHSTQMRIVKPVVRDMSAPQLLISSFMTAFPAMLALLPAMHGVLCALGGVVSEELLSPLGLSVPSELRYDVTTLVPSVISGYVAAYLVTRQLTIKQREFNAIKEAMDHSDRYFMLEQSMATQGGETSALMARRKSDAFKAVAVLWLLTKSKVCSLGSVLTSLNIVYLGMIWHKTSDLATPLAAALMYTIVELYLCQQPDIKVQTVKPDSKAPN